ncbi:hypothetical protein [Daejeonella sp.]|jgi:hypothetical protein|uniref:hypothetical protein n=1 Tax=Daejeonella sp. TaxID=2805397 RepID=UPI003782DFBA
MKSICLILFFLCAKLVQAHEPELSNLMIYEQNGKYFLVIKSSLTAFEGEIEYLFGKNSYKTPEEFQLLVIKHLQNNCLVIINDDTFKLSNPKVVLGHETTVFAELLNAPKKFNSIYVKNTLFKDMPNNMCELILSLKDLPQKQYILSKGNEYEVKLKVENGNWTVLKSSFKTPKLLFLFILSIVASVVLIIKLSKKKNSSNNGI